MTERRETHVLVVDDEKSLRFTLGEALRDEGYVPHEAENGTEAMARLREEPIELVLLDLRLQASGENGLQILKAIKKEFPAVEVVMMTAYGKFDDAVEATRLGCYQFLAKPFQLEQIKVVLEGALASARLRSEVEVLRRATRGRYPTDEVVGESPAFRETLEMVGTVAASRAPVLLLGETGAGKEVLAREVHARSAVAGGPLVELNCSAVPENLLESELFGHEKGAFTDAKERKKGVFELAHGGTLFLDEIGDMQVNLQAKLLRVLENGTFKRVGGTANLEVTVRVIAATNRDLKERVQAGQFREDLYYRLAVFPIQIPPLRERREDVLPLARFFLAHVAEEAGADAPGIAPDAARALTGYAWPGNVRELRNVMERAFLLSQGGTIAVRHLPRDLAGGEPGAAAPAATPEPGAGGVWSLADAEKFAIERAMLHFEGNKTRAAEALGISRGTLRIKLRQHGLEEA